MGHLLREIRKLNKRHAVVRETGKTVVINEEWDHALSRHVLSRCQSALNIDPLSACNVDPFGDARRRSYR